MDRHALGWAKSLLRWAIHHAESVGMIKAIKHFIASQKSIWNSEGGTPMMMWIDYEFEQQKKRNARRKREKERRDRMELRETTVEKQCQQFVEDIQRMKAELHTLMQAYERSVGQEKQLRTQDANINDQHKTIQQ